MRNCRTGLLPRVMTATCPDGQPSYPFELTWRACPAQSPGRILLGRIPLGQSPSLHRLRGRLALFGGFLGTTRLSDFPRPFITGRTPSGSRCGLRHSVPQTTVGSPGSRARCFRACAGSQTAGGPVAPRDLGTHQFCLSPASTTSAPRTARCCGNDLSRLDGGPARSPVKASRARSPTPMHDSGPVWVAIPSPYGSIPLHLAGFDRRKETIAQKRRIDDHDKRDGIGLQGIGVTHETGIDRSLSARLRHRASP
jgi:hypothetical protein